MAARMVVMMVKMDEMKAVEMAVTKDLLDSKLVAVRAVSSVDL